MPESAINQPPSNTHCAERARGLIVQTDDSGCHIGSFNDVDPDTKLFMSSIGSEQKIFQID